MGGEMGRERCEKERLGEGTILHSNISYVHTVHMQMLLKEYTVHRCF